MSCPSCFLVRLSSASRFKGIQLGVEFRSWRCWQQPEGPSQKSKAIEPSSVPSSHLTSLSWQNLTTSVWPQRAARYNGVASNWSQTFRSQEAVFEPLRFVTLEPSSRHHLHHWSHHQRELLRPLTGCQTRRLASIMSDWQVVSSGKEERKKPQKSPRKPSTF